VRVVWPSRGRRCSSPTVSTVSFTTTRAARQASTRAQRLPDQRRYGGSGGRVIAHGRLSSIFRARNEVERPTMLKPNTTAAGGQLRSCWRPSGEKPLDPMQHALVVIRPAGCAMRLSFVRRSCGRGQGWADRSPPAQAKAFETARYRSIPRIPLGLPVPDCCRTTRSALYGVGAPN
jgi:hypothetical protein